MKSKSANAVCLFIIKDFSFKGKRTTKIVEKLGSMKHLMLELDTDEEGVYKWANAKIATLNASDKKDTADVLVKYSQSLKISRDQINSFNGGFLFLQDIFYALGLDSICNTISAKHKFEYDFTKILSNLIYTRVLYPSSKLSSFDSSLKFIDNLPDARYQIQHFYRSLEVIETEIDFISAELYKNSVNVVKRNSRILYYDCTNFFFEVDNEKDDKRFGMSKEHRASPIVQMGLFMDGNGIPLAFNINPGNQNEQLSLLPLEKQIIKDFKLSQFVVCTDAGLASYDNRMFNNFGGRSYIVTQSIKKLKSHLIEWALDPFGWSLHGSKELIDISTVSEENNPNIYYKERWINENNLEQRLIVTYSPKYKVYQQTIRTNQVERAKNLVVKHKSLNKYGPNDSKRFIKEINITKDGEVASDRVLELNEATINNESKFDGFYAVCTTLEDPAESIITVNSRRWEIEESFRIMKSEFKSRPVYLQKKERIHAHFATCFLALMIYRILETKLNHEYTVSQIITTLQDMNFQHISGEGYVPTYTRTDITDKLHDTFGFNTDYQINTYKSFKKIIKQTKSHK